MIHLLSPSLGYLVLLGTFTFKKELESVPENLSRKRLFADLVKKLYDRGKATEAASFLEIDAVIDPGESRLMITKAFRQNQKLLFIYLH